MLGALVASSCSGPARRLPNGDLALLVNRQPVSLDEFRWFMELERAGVIQHFQASYGLEYGEGFWGRDCGGTTPRAVLQGNTVARVVRDKIEQSLFQELGLAGDISYTNFLAQLERVNRERAEAVRKGQAVYGPVHYSQLQFYGHWLATLRAQAQEKLARDCWEVTEAKLRAFFDQRQSLFRESDRLSLEIAYWRPDPGEAAHLTPLSPQSVAETIQSRLKAGVPMEQALSGSGGSNQVRVAWRRLEGLTGDRISERFPHPEQAARVLGLIPAEGLALAQANNTIALVRCTAKTPGTYLPYEQIAPRVRTRYFEEEYAKEISRRGDKAVVKVNLELVNSVPP